MNTTLTNLGSGTVHIHGNSQKWDQIELYASGVLRVSRRVTWRDSHTTASCRAETEVQYYPPGIWTSIAADVPTNGSLVVTSDRFDAMTLCDCVTEEDAHVAAAEFIERNYQDAEQYTRDITKLFDRYSYATSMGLNNGGCDKPTFHFIAKPPDVVRHSGGPFT